MSNKFILDMNDIKMIELVNGKTLLLVDGYSFHKHKKSSLHTYRWSCSSNKKNCPAFVVLTNDSTCVIRTFLEHVNHEVPIYKDLRNGKWVKI